MSNAVVIPGHPGLPNNIGNRRWWTKERVLQALKSAAAEIEGPLPCSDADYNRIKKGRWEWPVSTRVLEYFHSMPRAWLAAGASRDRVSLLQADWTEGEREHLMTFAGEETLETIGQQLRRSYGAAKRELYRHGTSARANQGLFSAAELAKHYQCPYHRVQDLLLTGVLKGKYDKVRHRWQVDIREVTPALEALLRAPKQTYTTYPPDLGDYRKRHGIRRVGGKEVRISR